MAKAGRASCLEKLKLPLRHSQMRVASVRTPSSSITRPHAEKTFKAFSMASKKRRSQSSEASMSFPACSIQSQTIGQQCITFCESAFRLVKKPSPNAASPVTQTGTTSCSKGRLRCWRSVDASKSTAFGSSRDGNALDFMEEASACREISDPVFAQCKS